MDAPKPSLIVAASGIRRRAKSLKNAFAGGLRTKRVLRTALCAGLFSLSTSAVAAYGFDPYQHVSSPTQPPDQQTDDGITWTAEQCAGDPAQWFYMPYEVAVAGHLSTANTGTSIDVVVKGRIFEITKTDGGWSYVELFDQELKQQEQRQQLQQQQASIESPSIALALSVGITIVLSAIGLAGWLEARKQNAARGEAEHKLEAIETAIEQREAQLRERECEVAKGSKSLERQQAEVDSQRMELEQQERSLVAAQRAVQLTRTAPTPEEWQKFGEGVRAEQFMGKGHSPAVAVQYFLDPQSSGAVVFEWEILFDRPQAPTLVVLRDGVEFRRETGSFKGRFGSIMLRKRKRYKFTFKLMDGQKTYPDPVTIELIVPPFQAWDNPSQPKKQTKEEWIAENVAWFKHAGQWPSNEKAQKEMLAKLDAEALKHFGEA